MSRLALLASVSFVAAAMLHNPVEAKGISYTVSKSRYESPAANNYRSARYDYLLQTNYRFRRYRMWKECNPINWIPLYDGCIASFDQYEPFIGRR